MLNWEPAETAPKKGQLLVRVERRYLSDDDGSIWEKVFGPVIWDIGIEAFTDIVGEPVNIMLENGIQKMTHWMEWPAELNLQEKINA
jgi:hypothetical protein